MSYSRWFPLVASIGFALSAGCGPGPDEPADSTTSASDGSSSASSSVTTPATTGITTSSETSSDTGDPWTTSPSTTSTTEDPSSDDSGEHECFASSDCPAREPYCISDEGFTGCSDTCIDAGSTLDCLDDEACCEGLVCAGQEYEGGEGTCELVGDTEDPTSGSTGG